jgi:SM-20-related protein
MIDLQRIAQQRLESEPYRWAEIDGLFSARDGAALAGSYPCDHFKRLADYGGEKDFEYESRALVDMHAHTISRPEALSDAWRALADDLRSPAYRAAMSALIGVDLSEAPFEVNVFHYPPGGSMGAHPDLRDKIVTHVLYFNESWNDADGGCLSILRSRDERDIAHTVSPIVGNSAVIVRSDTSWHAVSPVIKSCRLSRRAVTATFYRAGSVSTMWVPGATQDLHNYTPPATEVVPPAIIKDSSGAVMPDVTLASAGMAAAAASASVGASASAGQAHTPGAPAEKSWWRRLFA